MALDKTKTNPQLGLEIHKLLLEKGVETPTIDVGANAALSDDAKIETVRASFENIMTVLNLDLTDDSLQDTPLRVAKMLIRETMWGLDPKNFPKCTTVENKMGYDEMVVEKNVTVQSVCEHHWATIDGYATVAYIPGNKILGLSKIPRVIDYFARRPQIQERLTEQVFYALAYILETDNIAVAVHANHYCVRSRGIQDQNSSTVTSKLGGLFKTDPSTRAEFMSLLPKLQ